MFKGTVNKFQRERGKLFENLVAEVFLLHLFKVWCAPQPQSQGNLDSWAFSNVIQGWGDAFDIILYKEYAKKR